MSGLHLNHLIHWSCHIDLCYVYDDPGLTLPVCECGRILANSKKVQLQIENRKYLEDKVCTSSNCKVVGEKVFRKSDKKKVKIPENILFCNIWNKEDPKISHFEDAFCKAIVEFAETERKKVIDRNVVPMEDMENYGNEIKQRLKSEGKWDDSLDWRQCDCALVSMLIEAGDSKTLLSLPNQVLSEVLSCQHGGQAVGNNFRFLTYHLMTVYLTTNLIFALDLQDKPDQWGEMRPNDSYFRGGLMNNCDGQTFLHSCRKYLADDVYMKDFDAMRELCKRIFQFFYFVEMVRREVGCVEEEGYQSTKGYFF